MVDLVVVGEGGQMEDNWLDGLISNDDIDSERDNKQWKLFMVYKYVKLDKDKDRVSKDLRWNRINRPVNLIWCSRILKEYAGDLKKAARAIYEIGDGFENDGVSWNCSTVYRHLTDWENGKLR